MPSEPIAGELGWGPVGKPAPAATAPAVAASAAPDAALQTLVDQAATFNLFVAPALGAAPGWLMRNGSVVGLAGELPLHRFQIQLRDVTSAGVRASNVIGEVSGRLSLRLLFMPFATRALPGQEPPAETFDRTSSQRFVLPEATFTFGAGRDGFASFGTGRTFPTWAPGGSKLVVAAIGNLTAGFGKFAGLAGNYTLCAELTPEGALRGHLLVRVQDPQGALLARAPLPAIVPAADLDPATTFLAFAAQKGSGEDQVNRFSLGPDGQPRGVNISLWTKHVTVDCAAAGPEGFRALPIAVGGRVGTEIGCGRSPDPTAPPEGTALRPFPFEGVANYSFRDAAGRDVGAVTTNVIEGRRFDLRLAGAPDQPAFRFGFFGPVVLGQGVMRGTEGMFYGSSGSIFNPPPGVQVVTHYYVARIHDPQGRFRAREVQS